MTRDCKPARTGSWRTPMLTATLCFHISSFPYGSRLGQPRSCPLPKKRTNWKCSYNFCQSLRPLSLVIFVRQPKVSSLKKKTDIRPVAALEFHIYKDQKLRIRVLVQHTTFTKVLQAGTRASKQLTCSTQVSGGPVLLHHIRACKLSPPHLDTTVKTPTLHNAHKRCKSPLLANISIPTESS